MCITDVADKIATGVTNGDAALSDLACTDDAIPNYTTTTTSA